MDLNIKKYDFLGVSVSSFEKEQLIQFIETVVRTNLKKILYGYSLGSFYLEKKFPGILDYGEKSDLLVTDGRLLYLLAKWQGLQLKYEISIPKLVLLILKLANEHQWSIFLLGANEDENKMARINIKEKFPAIKSINGLNGYFEDRDEKTIIDLINSTHSNIILIGISSPKKEKIAVEWKEKLNCNIIIPCGGMIDVLAGKTTTAPSWVKKVGFASFYRFSQEPRRLLKRYSELYWFIFLKFFPFWFNQTIVKKNKNANFVKKKTSK